MNLSLIKNFPFQFVILFGESLFRKKAVIDRFFHFMCVKLRVVAKPFKVHLQDNLNNSANLCIFCNGSLQLRSVGFPIEIVKIVKFDFFRNLKNFSHIWRCACRNLFQVRIRGIFENKHSLFSETYDTETRFAVRQLQVHAFKPQFFRPHFENY